MRGSSEVEPAHDDLQLVPLKGNNPFHSPYSPAQKREPRSTEVTVLALDPRLCGVTNQVESSIEIYVIHLRLDTEASAGSTSRTASDRRLSGRSDQPEVVQTGVPAAADDDVVVYSNAKQARGFDDILGDGDVRLGWG